MTPTPVIDYSRKPPAQSTQPTVLFFHRTIIPPMLVVAVGFLAFGIAYFTQSPDAALHRISRNYAIGILIAGGISLAFAIGTMLSVRKQLKAKPA